jgi:hypothetical protein
MHPVQPLLNLLQMLAFAQSLISQPHLNS